MNFDSYIISDTKMAITVLPKCPPPYSHKGFGELSFRKKAFTLAEVLITLTIIGVVAAMTIPTLMSKYQKHTYVVGLKKAYSQLQNAWKMVPLTEGCPAGDYDCAGFLYSSEASANNNNTRLLSKQFKIVQFCETHPASTGPTICADWEQVPGRASFTTADGMTFSFYNASIGVDVNGKKGPNKAGRDQFEFLVSNYGRSDSNPASGVVIPYGSKLGKEHHNVPYWKSHPDLCYGKDSWDRIHCTGRVLEEDAMNY